MRLQSTETTAVQRQILLKQLCLTQLFTSSSSKPNIHHCSASRLRAQASSSTSSESNGKGINDRNSNLDNDVDNDEDFINVQNRIAAMLADDFTASTTSSSKANGTGETATVNNNNNNNNSLSRQSRSLVAIASCLFATSIFIFQHSQPVSALALLKAMEKDSVPLSVAVCNGKPTVIDFYADWCENCKAMAPTMRSIESEWKDKVNFVTIDGAASQNSALVQKFHVDGIPHLAFIQEGGEVKTALVGAVPRRILSEEINALVKVGLVFLSFSRHQFHLSISLSLSLSHYTRRINIVHFLLFPFLLLSISYRIQDKDLPYLGYDAFADDSHYPLAEISKTCPAT
jgi:thiol-disulfide isomerase/thioredoxin